MRTKQTSEGVKVVIDNSDWDTLDAIIELIPKIGIATNQAVATTKLLVDLRKFIETTVATDANFADEN